MKILTFPKTELAYSKSFDVEEEDDVIEIADFLVKNLLKSIRSKSCAKCGEVWCERTLDKMVKRSEVCFLYSCR